MRVFVFRQPNGINHGLAHGYFRHRHSSQKRRQLPDVAIIPWKR